MCQRALALEVAMKGSRRNQETQKFEAPNYANARGKAASDANKRKDDHDNPDANPGQVQPSSRPELENESGGWGKGTYRPIVVDPIDSGNSQVPNVEPHGIRRV
jgi:hypothetical protein